MIPSATISWGSVPRRLAFSSSIPLKADRLFTEVEARRCHAFSESARYAADLEREAVLLRGKPTEDWPIFPPTL